MIKESYTEKFYSYHSKYISNALALRPSQHDSLEIFARLCDTLSLQKNPTTLEQVEQEHKSELDTCDTDAKREKLLHKLASDAAEDFYRDDLAAVKVLCPTLTLFERDFPSVCFALATGIGKTRLMGACIAYLHYEKGIKNIFIMAPNLTIYNKLKADLGNTGNPKYVFRGLDRFVNPPRIIDGDNYADFRQGTFGVNDVVINIFNISKAEFGQQGDWW
ncbi:MAG: DEAD/DEAH box helicase family protein [Lachnospiraceae bacterium]|nr:DEAD/DEAH box helicase family protein [Lachnospiraceae bacterium]